MSCRDSKGNRLRHKHAESKMELFRWSNSYQLDMHSCQIRALIQEFREANRREKENNFQRYLLKEKQFTLKGHWWLFMLYIGKGTLQKQGVPREKEKFSLFCFLNNSQNLLCFNGMLHLKYLLRHHYMSKELGIQKKKKNYLP